MQLAIRQRKAAHLARWLGPWASGERSPERVIRRTETIEAGDRTIRAYRYEPENRSEVTGAYLVVPGLHFRGPDDPRLDRFCRILASSGLLVLGLILDEYLSLRFNSISYEDTRFASEHVARICAERGLPRPALFSISFGSAPAIQVASDQRSRDQVGALVLFGGFCDFRATLRFAISGRAYENGRPVALPHDPLNAPAVAINTLPFLGYTGGAPEPLAEAWLEMARRTWGQLELRPAARRWPIAEALAGPLPRGQRDLFFVGCGLSPGGGVLLESALATAGPAFDFAEAKPRLRDITVPVSINHGRDDDVVPYLESVKIRRGLRSNHPHLLHLTGLFSHTASSLPAPRELADELEQLSSMVFALVDAPHEALA